MRFIPLLSFFLLITISAFGQNGLIKPYPLPKVLHSSNAKQIVSQRSLIHAKALMNIKKNFNISDAHWHFYMDTVYDLVLKDDLFTGNAKQKKMINDSDHWLIKEAKKVLIECGVNLNRITITLNNDPNINAAAWQWFDSESYRINHELLLNVNWFTQLSTPEREAVLRHEVMHLAQYDVIEEGYLYGLLENAGYKKEQFETSSSFINYRKERETRADLLAIVDSPLLMQSEYNRLKRFAKYTASYPQEYWVTHPSYKKRAEDVAQLISFINRPAVAA